MASVVAADKPQGTMAAALARAGLTIEAQEERLLSFLVAYQAANNGATPSYEAIANQLGIAAEGVRVLLARLENKGRIHFISRNPPRIMLVGPDTVLPHEPGAADKPADGAYDRFLDAEAARMRLARFIAEAERDKGYGPSLREMMDFIGYGNAGYIRRMAEILAERGLIQYGPHLPTKLTAVGRQFFGLPPANMEEQMNVHTTIEAKRKCVVVQKGKRPAVARVDALCEALAEYQRAVGLNESPRFGWLAVKMGFNENSVGSVGDVAQAAAEAGYLEPRSRRHGSKDPLRFTAKGLERFMRPPEPEFAEVDEPPLAEPEPAPTTLPEPPAFISVAGPGGLDFDLTSKRLRVSGATQSRAELAAFIGKLGALMPFLGE